MAKSKFLKISCPKCGNNQLVFSKSSTKVSCSKCNTSLVTPTGGKTKVKAEVKEVLWK